VARALNDAGLDAAQLLDYLRATELEVGCWPIYTNRHGIGTPAHSRVLRPGASGALI
jgi:hypothetical protein